MARKKNITPDGGPHSAAHTAAPPPPAPSATPPADGPAAAVWAALTATPGATAAQIAAAAGTSRMVAGQELAALETSGLATRAPGTRTGRGAAPATWQPAPSQQHHLHPLPPLRTRVRQARPGQRTALPQPPARQTLTRAFPRPAPARDRTRTAAVRQRQPPPAAPLPALPAGTRPPTPQWTAGTPRQAQAPPRAAALEAPPPEMTRLRRRRTGSRSLRRPVRPRCCYATWRLPWSRPPACSTAGTPPPR